MKGPRGAQTKLGDTTTSNAGEFPSDPKEFPGKKKGEGGPMGSLSGGPTKEKASERSVQGVIKGNIKRKKRGRLWEPE